MKAISLEDLQPQGSEFSLSQTGKTYRLRAFNLRDEEWLRTTFGDKLPKIMEQMEMRSIARIVFHQLDEECKKDFGKKAVDLMNEEGDVVTKTLGGYELLYGLIEGWGERIEILKALLQTLGISREMVDGFTKEEIDAEKQKEKRESDRIAALPEDQRDAELEKKNEMTSESEPTGHPCLTDFQANTDGPLNTSGAELGARSGGD